LDTDLTNRAATAEHGSGIDPVTFAIVRHALNSAGKEMTVALERSARSPFIALQRDHSCSIYDNQQRLLNLEDALPVHSVGGSLMLQAIRDMFGDDINEGDCFLCNHPFYGVTHLGDLTVALPVFYEGEHLFWAITRAHQQNVGQAWFGLTPTSIWQEGIKVPPVKIADRGKTRQDVIQFYLENVRLPDWLEGDLLAMIGSVHVARKRLQSLAAQFGIPGLRRNIEQLIGYASRRTVAEIRDMPEGIYVGEAWADSDGTGARNIKVRATVTIEDEHVTIDLSGSDPQVDGAINSSLAAMQANAAMAVLSCIDPSIPHNEGCLQHLTITAPKGTVVNAEWPYATASCTVLVGDVISDAVWRAMVQAVPDRAPAGWGRWQISNTNASGDDRRFGGAKPYMSSVMAGGSAGGATKGYDGWPLTQTACSLGAMKAESIEMRELLFPHFVEKAEFAQNSGGAGTWVGGYGIDLRIRPVGGPMRVNAGGDGHRNPPFGAWGGHPGSGGGGFIEDTETGRRVFYDGKGMAPIVQPNQLWCTESTGGGGFGSPLDRDPSRVLAEYRGEYITADVVHEVYGVVLSEDSKRVDEAATNELRARMRRQESINPYSPDSPGAGNWIERNMREGDALEREVQPEILRSGLSIFVR
jgi:N-methylhydantoinase B